MRAVIRFSKFRVIAVVLSILVILAGGVLTFTNGGFNFGIDFQAGLSMRLEITDGDAEVPTVRDALAELGTVQVQSVGGADDSQFNVRVSDDGTTADFQRTVSTQVLELLNESFDSVVALESAYVGPRFSADLAQQAIFLIVFALGLILVYIWFRFRFGYALAAIAALLHDVLFMLGFIGALQLEVTTATIAAVLTIIGYSLNDTIVIFDRIRENEILLRDNAFIAIADTSITQSLSRTIITSLTTLLAVIAIYIFTTGSIQLFALNLIVGVLVGTYSSIFIASPSLIAWQASAEKRRKKRDAEKYHRGSVTKETETGTMATPSQPVDVEATKRALAQQRSKKKGRK